MPLRGTEDLRTDETGGSTDFLVVFAGSDQSGHRGQPRRLMVATGLLSE